MTNLDEAIELWITNGWHLETRTYGVAIMSYDDRGYWARSLDQNRNRLARVSLSLDDQTGAVRPRLLSKATTNLLHWYRYVSTKRKMVQP